MLRKFIAYTFLLTLYLLQSACVSNHHGSMQTITPNLANARTNAQLGIRYLHRGETNLAAERFILAKQQAPHDPIVLDALGYSYEKMGDVEKANQYYFYALLIAPRNGTVRSNYGNFLCRNGYYSQGVFYLTQASRTHGFKDANQSMQSALHCVQKLHHGVGDNTEYAYYSKILRQPIIGKDKLR